MLHQALRTTVKSTTGALLLGVFGLAGTAVQAAGLTINPSTQLGSIPEAGAPSFVFNDKVGRFGNDVQNWFDNYVVVQNDGGSSGNYNFFAHNEGNFTFWDTMDSNMAGVGGSFDLNATFDSNGALLAGGTVQITGAIADLGIFDPNTVLMTAELVGFEFAGDLIGFAINNINCDAAIAGCATDPSQRESVYFALGQAFPGIAELAGSNYRTTMINKTTVPLPAGVWLMLSGLSCFGFMARKRSR